MQRTSASPRFGSTILVAKLLLITFVAEASVMFLLPILLPDHQGGWAGATADAFLLVVVLTPILWWLIIRPLQNITVHEQQLAGAERKQSAQLLAEQSRILESFFKLVQTCLVILDTHFNFIRVNDAFAQAYRRDASAFAGRNYFKLYPSAELTAAFECVVRTKKPFHAFARPFTFPDQPERGVTSWDLILVPSLDDRGDVEFLVFSLNEVTERVRALESLRLESAALHAAAAAIVITNRTGIIERVNPAFTQLSGYTAEEAIGKHHRNLVNSGTHAPAFFKDLWESILAGRTWRGEVVNRRKDRRLYTEFETVTPILDASGAITHFVAIQQDITERLQLEAQFRQAHKMEGVGQLTSGIAHDFNNLLTIINGMADLVLDQVGLDDPVHADVEEIRRAGDRAATLTRQLLAFSRQQILEPRVLNVNTVVAGIESLLQRLLGEDIALAVVPTPGVANVKADPGQIEQVVTNLAINARDAMLQGGRLTIETRNVTINEDHARQHDMAMPPGSYVQLTVSDSGVGMDEATCARIFEPFFTTKGPGRGTGLGLSTVYGIVTQSHGFIEVESEVGQGTSFKMYLPQVTEAAALDRLGPTVVPSYGTETILLVEDDAELRRLATRFLEPAGYTVFGAATGEEALRLMERLEKPVHLLLSDVVLPGVSGRQLAEHVTQTRPDMKVLFMSGYTSDIILQHGVLEGETNFLHKPFTAAALRRKVREVLDSSA